MTNIHEARCSCGELRIACTGEPVRRSMCHCLACQRRTGSIFGVQVRYPRNQIVSVSGEHAEYVRVGDSGSTARFRFCPRCGSTVYWELDAVPGEVAIAVGAFADPAWPPPRHSVYEERRHPWIRFDPDLPIEREV